MGNTASSNVGEGKKEFSRPNRAPVVVVFSEERELRNTEVLHVLEARRRPTRQNFLSSNQGKMGVSRQ